ncbi:hypothetical protein [Rothia sp. P3C3.S176]|uniref:hypothetical protein n=1 Tax=Rothia sp. P3C3.S176 TaxID=2962204 RepID=UPI0020C92FA6|nr:hypothetical protein [Rothia sp. P3C3.S176]MCP8995042.1 hypothetical protein [Rothia sp. P3C3.S176]
MTNPKTKRDRAAGRHHRHTAIQGIIDDIASINNSIAALQGETCDICNKLVVWTARFEGQNEQTRQNVIETKGKVAAVEHAVTILKGVTRRQMLINANQVTINKLTNSVQKEHQEAIAQLIAYTNNVNGRADALQQETDILREELNETNKRLIQLAWITVGVWAITAITIFAFLIVS